MRRVFYLALVSVGILCPTLASAQLADNRQIENDPRAQSILDRVSTKHQNYESIQIGFTLSVDSPRDDFFQKSEGTVYVKDQKFRIETDEMEIICDNVKKWVYLKESNELQINYYEPDLYDIQSPSQLWSLYKKHYYFRLIGEVTQNGERNKLIELIPEDVEESPYTKIHLMINDRENKIVEAKVYGNDGVLYTWEMSDFMKNISMNESTFSFDPAKHPDIHVDDMTK